MTADYKASVSEVTSATEARDVLRHMPEHLSEQNQFLRTRLGGLLETVATNPDAAEAVTGWLDAQELHATGFADVTHTFETSHQEDFERIETGTAQDAAWDITRNRPL